MKRSFFVALMVSCWLYPAPATSQPESGEFSAGEEKAASLAAETALRAKDFHQGKIVLTNSAVILDNSVNPPQRYALFTFYRYEGDLAILITLQLDNMTVTRVERHPHMPTSLAPQEIAEAHKIARAHPDIQKALARYKHLGKIEIDTIAAQIINPQVAGYHHRVARLFFRDEDRNYLSGVPMVDVDLTTGEVRFDLIRKMHDKRSEQ